MGIIIKCALLAFLYQKTSRLIHKADTNIGFEKSMHTYESLGEYKLAGSGFLPFLQVFDMNSQLPVDYDPMFFNRFL